MMANEPVWCCGRAHPLLTIYGVRCTICQTVWIPKGEAELPPRKPNYGVPEPELGYGGPFHPKEEE